MAVLLAETRGRQLSSATEGIGEIKRLYENELRTRGFSDVIRNNAEVAGNKAGCRLSILHLPISGPNFYEIFMVAGDTEEATRSVLAEAVGIKFHFL